MPEASLAIGRGVHEALVPWVLSERGVHVVIHRKLPLPRGCRECMAEPDGQQPELRVAPPQAREPRPHAYRANELAQHRLHVLVVGAKRDGAVPSPHLLLEGVTAARAHLALPGILVAAGHLLTLCITPGYEVLVFTHEAQERARAADLVGLAFQLDVDQIAGEWDILVERPPRVEPGRPVKPIEHLPRTQDPGWLAQLRGVLVVGDPRGFGEEKGQRRDFGEVDHEPLVLPAAQAASIAEDVPTQEARRDVLRRLPGQPARHEVPAGAAGCRLLAPALWNRLQAAWHFCDAVVIAADAKPCCGKADLLAQLTHSLHVRLVLRFRHQQHWALSSILEAWIGCASCQQPPPGFAEVVGPGHTILRQRPGHVQVAQEPVVVALRLGPNEALRDDEAQLSPGVANPLARCQLVAVVPTRRPRHWHLALVRLEGVRAFKQRGVHPCRHLGPLPLGRLALAEGHGLAALDLRFPESVVQRRVHGADRHAPGEGLHPFGVGDEATVRGVVVAICQHRHFSCLRDCPLGHERLGEEMGDGQAEQQKAARH
mmetsp:Transcript_125424/g.349023  ORF Transcript_125424/g.349023 Transcript_125424/m.349023 type:complete len:543 (-) Transcript_125424:222-1850(-)